MGDTKSLDMSGYEQKIDHMSPTPTAAAADLPPATSPSMHSRQRLYVRPLLFQIIGPYTREPFQTADRRVGRVQDGRRGGLPRPEAGEEDLGGGV